jgi:hypothetical protein
MTTTEPLTEREQQALEQMHEAQEQGSTLKDYAAKIGHLILAQVSIRSNGCHPGGAAPTPSG